MGPCTSTPRGRQMGRCRVYFKASRAVSAESGLGNDFEAAGTALHRPSLAPAKPARSQGMKRATSRRASASEPAPSRRATRIRAGAAGGAEHIDDERLADEVPDERTRIWQAVNAIPSGRVSTYGAIALLAALPRRARLVGRVLSHLPSGSRLPWHRVVNASGQIVQRGGAALLQAKRLTAEGIKLRGTRLDLKTYGWPDPDEQHAD